jgi:two-component system cell cycle response regulator DivK
MRKQQSKESILVVDDYDDIRVLMKRQLERWGYLVFEAADGREAVLVAKREHPDLILMDLNLPTLDGFIATQYIRELEELRNVPIVAVTADSKEYSQKVAIAAGCDDYLEKPVDFEHLDLVIRRLLSNHKVKRPNHEMPSS